MRSNRPALKTAAVLILVSAFLPGCGTPGAPQPPSLKLPKPVNDLQAVRKGDTVITSGGLVGKITKVVDDDQIEVEVADGVRVRQMRSMVADVRAKGEPVKEESASS